jgi:uncharacterized OB-fold protein
MEIPRHWRLKAQRYRLEGSICPTCGQVTFPPRPVCPHCTTQPLRIDACGPSVLTTSIVIPASNRTLDTVLLKG